MFPLCLGRCERDTNYHEAVPYSHLKAARAYPQQTVAGAAFWPCVACVLPGGDRCKVEDFVAVSEPRVPGIQFVAQVVEIIQSASNLSDLPDMILVRACELQELPLDVTKTNPYGMPYIRPANIWLLLPPSVRLRSVALPFHRLFTDK
jgi:hypothetical protein